MDITFHTNDDETICSVETDSIPCRGDVVTISESTETPRKYVVQSIKWRIQGNKIRAIFVAVNEVNP